MKTMTFVALLMAAGSAYGQSIDHRKLNEICRDTQQKQTADSRIEEVIRLAELENTSMGGQQIDRNGGLVRIGNHESENERTDVNSPYAWKAVEKYWASIGEDAPYHILIEGKRYERSEIFQQIKTLNYNAPKDEGIDDTSLEAVRSALYRTSLVDTPWSAAFISYLFKTSGYDNKEFTFSDAHIDYIDQAFAVSEGETQGVPEDSYAYRACDIKKTKPRAGDLICYVREKSKKSNDFGSLYELSKARRNGKNNKLQIASHCDVVISSDKGKDSKLKAIGGNVVQSVTLRHMNLTAGKIINPNYVKSTSEKQCSNTERDCLGNLNLQAWVVLLQRRN